MNDWRAIARCATVSSSTSAPDSDRLLIPIAHGQFPTTGLRRQSSIAIKLSRFLVPWHVEVKFFVNIGKLKS